MDLLVHIQNQGGEGGDFHDVKALQRDAGLVIGIRRILDKQRHDNALLGDAPVEDNVAHDRIEGHLVRGVIHRDGQRLRQIALVGNQKLGQIDAPVVEIDLCARRPPDLDFIMAWRGPVGVVAAHQGTVIDSVVVLEPVLLRTVRRTVNSPAAAYSCLGFWSVEK